MDSWLFYLPFTFLCGCKQILEDAHLIITIFELVMRL